MVLESEELLLRYLASDISSGVETRVICKSCNRSRSIYCPSCLQLFIVPRFRQLRLPFDLDIILDDKREHATGVHAKMLSDVTGSFNCCLFDYGRGDTLGSYNENVEGTYLLFPGKSSVPLETLDPSKIKKLVVLDCKWTKTSIRLHKGIIDKLSNVHLVNVPNESQFWRWHSAGKGMVSTIEAIYYCAWELSKDWAMKDRENLVHLFWIFRLQRNIIQQRHASGQIRHDPRRPKAPPFSKEQKEFQSLRRKQKTVPTISLNVDSS